MEEDLTPTYVVVFGTRANVSPTGVEILFTRPFPPRSATSRPDYAIVRLPHVTHERLSGTTSIRSLNTRGDGL